jgi:ferritin-like metal-binding protein YciE
MAKTSTTNEKVVREEKTATRPNASGKVAKADKSLHHLLVDGLKEIYSAEKQLLEAMPEIIRACNSGELAEALSHHMEETKRHLDRLDKIFRRLGIEKSGEEKCAAMQGLIKEVKGVTDNYDKSPVRDSALIIGAQKIEHYEIACYGSLCELCDVLGFWNICDVLGRSLDEEEKADLELTEIAMYINDEAFEMSENEYEEAEEE